MVLSDLFMRMRNGCFQFKKEKKILYVKSLCCAVKSLERISVTLQGLE